MNNDDMTDYTKPDFLNDFNMVRPPLPRYLSDIGLSTEPHTLKETWNPVEPHSLGLNLELERKATEITDITLCEQTKPTFWDFENIMPPRRSRTNILVPDNFGYHELEETFPVAQDDNQDEMELPALSKLNINIVSDRHQEEKEFEKLIKI